MKTPRKILNSTRADEVAKTLSVSITPSDLSTRARKIARSRRLRALPVTEGGNLRGILRLRDLLKITSTHSNIKVSGLMKPLTFTATPNWNLAELAQKAIEMDIPVVPLTKSQTNKTLLGVVRLEDILDEIADACGERPKIDKIMTKEVLTAHPEERISKVWTTMEESNISGIPVVDRGKPIGMLTRLDIIQSGRSRFAAESKKGRVPPKVKTIMQTPIITISSDAPIKEAVMTMKKHDVGRLPVTEGERLIGIVDREDVIKPYL